MKCDEMAALLFWFENAKYNCLLFKASLSKLQPGFQSPSIPPSHLTSNLIYLSSYANAMKVEPKFELFVLSDPHADSLSKDIEGILFLLSSVYQNLVVSSWSILIF